MDAEKLKELRELVAGAKTGPKELPENEALFVAAVNALPALLDEVEALRELALAATDTTPERRREKWSCHYGITTARNCSRCGPQLALLDRIAARHEPKDAE